MTYTLTSATPTTIGQNDYYFITESVTSDGANTADWGWEENNLTPMQIGYYSGTYGVSEVLAMQIQHALWIDARRRTTRMRPVILHMG